jgi:quercetin dioxygenase-like cupin family protein
MAQKMTLFRSTQIFAMLLASLSASAAEPADTVQSIMPDEIKWVSVSAAPGVQLAWLTGAADKAGPYVLRVRMEPGSAVPPHSHPDDRYITVLSGELHLGLGTTAEPDKTKAYPAGSFFIAPAGVAHYVVVKNSEVAFQEDGVGPTATNWVKK